MSKFFLEVKLPLGVTTRSYIKRTVEQMLGNIASLKELWMSGIKYQRK